MVGLTLVEFIGFCNALSVAAKETPSWSGAPDTDLKRGTSLKPGDKSGSRKDSLKASEAVVVSVRPLNEGIDLNTFTVVHRFFQYHIQTGTTLDDFFETEFY